MEKWSISFCLLLASHLILGLFREIGRCLCSVNRQIRLGISASAWLIFTPTGNLIFKAFETAPAWREAACLGMWALLGVGSQEAAWPRCQAEPCAVPAAGCSQRRGCCSGRERLLCSPHGGNSFSPQHSNAAAGSATQFVLGQRCSGRMVRSGEQGLYWLSKAAWG